MTNEEAKKLIELMEAGNAIGEFLHKDAAEELISLARDGIQWREFVAARERWDGVANLFHQLMVADWAKKVAKPALETYDDEALLKCPDDWNHFKNGGAPDIEQLEIFDGPAQEALDQYPGNANAD